MTEPHEIAATVKAFVLNEFLEGESPDELQETTPLMTTGILDSISTLKLISFLESRFGVSIAAHETDVEHFNTLSDVIALIRAKQGN